MKRKPPNKKSKKPYSINRNKFLSMEQQEQLIKTCKMRHDNDLAEGRKTWVQRYYLVYFALNTGLRVGEIAALQIKHCHLHLRQPYIEVINGKGNKDRDVQLDKVTRRELQDFLERKKIWQFPTDKEAFLFSNKDGSQQTTTNLHISFKKAILESNLPNTLSIHSARHTYATYLYYQTKDLIYVQQQLGHSSMEMTSHYAGLAPEGKEEITNKYKPIKY